MVHHDPELARLGGDALTLRVPVSAQAAKVRMSPRKRSCTMIEDSRFSGIFFSGYFDLDEVRVGGRLTILGVI